MNSISNKKNRLINGTTLESIFVVILMMYPLRHIYEGLDLWDTGYNYGNFAYMGLEHMDSMWLYSTYLANAVGHVLTGLPRAGSLVGMNLYTGLFVSVLALAGYLFATRKIGVPQWIAFVGEFAAISLCWCPTALLYNYLTYVLFLGCVILLYLGLTREKMWYLFVAGVCLGVNVLVRFSNLPEAAMIVAVWAYAYICAVNEEKLLHGNHSDKDGSRKTKATGIFRRVGAKAWSLGFRHTLWCLGGYLGALVVLFGYIHIRYGLDEYIAGIMRLFAMTDNATDYKPTSMLMGVVGAYVENMYWVIRIAVIVIAGMLVSMIAESVALHCKVIAGSKGCSHFLKWGSIVFSVALAMAMLYWLYARGFCSLEFYSYGSMLRPGILFLMLTMFIGALRIVHPRAPKEEKLISGMLILVILLTSLGSNNGVYPSMNNLFVAAPYTFWECWKFVKNVKVWEVKKLVVSAFPAKCILIAFLGMFLFQISLFGMNFVFVEATGGQNATATVENNEILKGIKMSPERAQWMTEITDYVKANDLQGKELIPYGWIPSLAYYLEMPPAFNSWSDLRSYSLEQMKLDLAELAEDMVLQEQEKPVIVVEKKYAEYWEHGTAGLVNMGLTDAKIAEIEGDAKWQLLVEFMQVHGYEQTFSNDKFVMWE